MVLNLVDLIAFNEVLEIYVAAGTLPSEYKRINKEGDEVESFSLGGLAFAAVGPGASVANSWGLFLFPASYQMPWRRVASPSWARKSQFMPQIRPLPPSRS